SPTVAAVTADPDELRGRAERMADALRDSDIAAAAVPSDGRVGGGGAPELLLPGWAVAVPAGWVQPLRRGRPAVVARVDRDRCLLDLRCVPADADAQLITAVRAVASAVGRAP
ncbi:MAG: L-seryl-tRNA(Sec) selenium transferase, partial [Actinomycetota bacterium]